MNTEEVFLQLQALNGLIIKITKREPEAIAELNRLYRILYGETVTAGCSNCHIKAFHKLTSLTIDDLNTMNDQNFKIKKGVLVEYPFQSGQFFSAALGVSDELATEYLTAHPQMIEQFEVYPGSESESKELDLSLLETPADLSENGDDENGEKPLSRMNKTELQSEYLKVLGTQPDEELTKAQLTEAINAKA
jgi:hypothetical protein